MKLTLEMIGILLTLAILCALIATAIGCNERPLVKQPDVCPPAKWLTENIERMNGPSLTGYSRAQHEMTIKKCGWLNYRGEWTGTRRWKVGIVPIREPMSWDEFDNYQRQVAVVGIGLEIRF